MLPYLTDYENDRRLFRPYGERNTRTASFHGALPRDRVVV